MAEKANIASFAFENQTMYSQSGYIVDSLGNYTGVTTSDGRLDNPLFKSNLYLNGETGEFQARTGYIGGFTIHKDMLQSTHGTTPSISLNGKTGAGHLAGGNISWDGDGTVTFGPNVTLNWSNITNTPTIPDGVDDDYIKSVISDSYIKGTVDDSYIKNIISDDFIKATFEQAIEEDFTTKITSTYITTQHINTLNLTSLGEVTAGSFSLGNGNFIVNAEGNLTAKNAEITGVINALNGEIGGFNIASGRLGVAQSGDNPTNNGMALYNEFIKFSDYRSSVFLGTNVLPATSGTTALARLESTHTQDIKKYGLVINVSGANSYFGGNNNVAISLQKGVIDRLRWQIKAKNASSGSHVFSDETEVVLYLQNSSYYVALPYNPEVGEMKIITRVNDYNVQVRGNGNQIMETVSAATSTLFFGPDYTIKAKSLIFRWDGDYWIMNQWT